MEPTATCRAVRPASWDARAGGKRLGERPRRRPGCGIADPGTAHEKFPNDSQGAATMRRRSIAGVNPSGPNPLQPRTKYSMAEIVKKAAAVADSSAAAAMRSCRKGWRKQQEDRNHRHAEKTSAALRNPDRRRARASGEDHKRIRDQLPADQSDVGRQSAGGQRYAPSIVNNGGAVRDRWRPRASAGVAPERSPIPTMARSTDCRRGRRSVAQIFGKAARATAGLAQRRPAG